MKELSIEEKAKAYDEALERAKEWFKPEEPDSYTCIVESIFPELKESEDEGIMEALIDGFKRYDDGALFNGCLIRDIVAWLEKQVEHARFIEAIQVGDQVTRNEDGVLVNLSQLKRVAKPSEQNQGEQNPAWSEEDGTVLDNLIYALANDGIGNNREEYVDWLKYLKDRVLPQPKQEWSEDDEKEVAVLEAYIRSKDWSERHIDRALGIVDELVNKAKSLRPQNTWKPSEEQMKALKEAVDEHFDIDGGALWHLYENLKKLREE